MVTEAASPCQAGGEVVRMQDFTVWELGLRSLEDWHRALPWLGQPRRPSPHGPWSASTKVSMIFLAGTARRTTLRIRTARRASLPRRATMPVPTRDPGGSPAPSLRSELLS